MSCPIRIRIPCLPPILFFRTVYFFTSIRLNANAAGRVYENGTRRAGVYFQYPVRRADIDLNRKIILIKAGKGRKDRISLLSDTLIHWLGDYYEKHNPKVWLFEGRERGTDLRYIQELLGHHSSKTTESDTHISRKGLNKLKSSLDNLTLDGLLVK